MGDVHRRHALVDAPVEDVWAVVSDPRTHADWWPEIVEVTASGEVGEGGEYTRVQRRMGFLDLVDAVWVAERLEHLKEVRFRCTVSGTYAHFSLTPARGETFVELESGVLPTNRRWQLFKRFGGPALRRWVQDMLDALPEAVARRRSPVSGAS